MTITDACAIAGVILSGLSYLRANKAANLGHENKKIMNRVETQTNGMSQQLQINANKEGRAEGKAQEQSDQADRDANGAH
jgi:hypothetical protein